MEAEYEDKCENSNVLLDSQIQLFLKVDEANSSEKSQIKRNVPRNENCREKERAETEIVNIFEIKEPKEN